VCAAVAVAVMFIRGGAAKKLADLRIVEVR
jgi:hypothetical protein